MSVLEIKRDGKLSVKKAESFCEFYPALIYKNEIGLIISDIDNLLMEISQREFSRTIDKNALANAHGDWFEWIIYFKAIEIFKLQPSHLLISLPNIKQFDVVKLYKQKYYDYILDLKQKINHTESVNLVTSNPDFVIIDKLKAQEIFDERELTSDITLGNLNKIDLLYEKLINTCDLDDILGFVAAKSSLRPDRRLQIAHEGSLFKAIYAHLVTREWNLDPKGLKYYALTQNSSEADINALKTVATHSIVTVTQKPQAAVDSVYNISSLSEAENLLISFLASM